MKPVRRNVLLIFDLPAKPNGTDYASQFRPEDWEVVQDVQQGLAGLGHDVRPLGLYDSVRPLIAAIRRHPPDIVFNLLDAVSGERRHESNVVGLLELLDVPYTGSGPATLTICRNKLFTKRILSPHTIRVPRSVTFPCGQRRRSLRQLQFPVFVKPLGLEGSDGITQSSFAEHEAQCLERVAFLHDHYHTDALVEEYIEGRELYASVIGGRRPRLLPLRELVFGEFPEERPKFATFKAKWDDAFRQRWGISNQPAADLPAGVEARIAQAAKRAFRLLQVSGYARLDLRLTPAGEVYVIEVNPNPALNRRDEVAQSAEAAGLTYPELLQQVLEWGLEARRC